MHVKISTLAEYSVEINEFVEMTGVRFIFDLTRCRAEYNLYLWGNPVKST